jgi:phosphoenolpyruvate carboxylase
MTTVGEHLTGLLREVLTASGAGAIAGRLGDAPAERAPAPAPEDPAFTEKLLQASSILFHLLNIAEEFEAAQARRAAGERAAALAAGTAEPFRCVVQLLRQQGVTPEHIRRLLAGFEIQPVLTAHPTEAKRITILEIHRRIYEDLSRRFRSGLAEWEAQELDDRLRAHIEVLWHTGHIYLERPRVVDEVENGLFYFRESFYPLAPLVLTQLYRTLAEAFPNERFDIPAVLQFSSWRGGDRDGNPFVTAAVTRQTLRRHASLILELYQEDVRGLIQRLSHSVRETAVSEELRQSIQEDAAAIPNAAALTARNPHEPYRLKAALIGQRLSARAEGIAREQPPQAWPAHAYRRAEDFLADVARMRRSLEAHAGGRAAETWLRPLEFRIKTFGFHLAKLDVRESSDVLERAMDELSAAAGGGAYTRLSEADRRAWLLRALASPRPLWDAARRYSEATTEVMDTVRAIPWAQRELDVESLGSYIVSMTRDVSDLLMVYLLLKEAGAFRDGVCPISVVPLFETIDALRRAPTILGELFGIDLVRRSLALRRHLQQVMVGYSDSNKDGGLVASQWRVQTAQSAMLEVADREGVVLKFFHGLGGSISRGGGPTDEFIFSLPPKTLRGRIKITEQGEVISSKYANPDTALDQLKGLVGSVMAASLENVLRPAAIPAEFGEEMERLSATAAAAYRALVEDPGFLPYFQATSPIGEIGQLNIGSRPAKRRPTARLEDLRAIPWVFSWTQNRHVVSGWYGAGGALADAVGDPSRLARLRRMFGEWRFFRRLIRSIATSLLTADLSIARAYAQLCEDAAIRGRVQEHVAAEHARATAALLAIAQASSLADVVPDVAQAAAERERPLREVHRLQVALLRRARRPEASDADRTNLLLSINCIAAALRTTG